ncbi:PREDICTED: uncharacterized protein At2g29880-like [Camelina sativa]|uniref:Uncharacterized protein At2g29880-like n=1 Tax=Camelina sativa TaxID=90675 RepID=A0ABM0UGW1_CAMSA|nr:PREDICTED: uncharacterized protein At2g29880-like [Camelina sativa]
MDTGEGSHTKTKTKKNSYNSWTYEECQELQATLVEAIKREWRDKSGSINKATVETKILPMLNKKLKCNKTYTNYLSRMKTLRREYNVYSELLRFSSGFGWDPIRKQFTAPDDVWAAYLLGHPRHENLRTNTFEDFEDLQLIFETVIAKGINTFGLGSDSNAETFEDEDDDLQARDDLGDDDEVDEVSVKPKLPTRKRAKTSRNGDPLDSTNNHGESSEKVLTEMVGVSTQIISLIQQREERQQREVELREIQKKKNNVWDAVKEIPDLEDHVRYDAVTKIHTLKMKDVFVSMSVEDRLGWILRNT